MPLPRDDGLVRLTKQEAAELARLRGLKNRAYRGTPLGLLAGRYIRWKKNEWGATEATMVGYEAVVAEHLNARASRYAAESIPREKGGSA